MASLPPPASPKLRDKDAVESRRPERRRPLEPPPATVSGLREPNMPPSSRRRSRSPSKARRRSRSLSPSNVWRRSRSPSPSKVRRRSSSSPPPSKIRRPPPPSKVRRRCRSPPPSKVRHRSRSPPPSKVRRRSRSLSSSPPPSKVRRRSRSPPPSKVRCRSRSSPPSKLRRRSRSSSPSSSPSPSKIRCRSRLPSPSKIQCRSRSPPSKVRRRSRSPPPSNVRRRSRSPPPSNGQRQTSSPPYTSTTQRLEELQRTKRPLAATAVDDREEGDMVGPSPLHEALVENRPSKAPSRNARRKKIRRQVWTEAKKQMRKMKRDKLLDKIKKLKDCVWLLEKDGADMAEIMKVRSLLKSTQKQYEENEAQLAEAGSSASQQVLNSDRREKTHVETVAAPVVVKVEGDKQKNDSGEAEGRSPKGCKETCEQSELAEEANRLKSEIEAVRQDHDYQLAQVQSLMADVAKQKEVARMYGAELEDAMRRVAALEEGSLLQRETIRTLQAQLSSANEKLTVVPPSSKD